MKRYLPYAALVVLVGVFFWEFTLNDKIPIDATPLYEMRPWSNLPQAKNIVHAIDPARYYHNIDPVIEVLPIKRWLAQQLKEGELPLWTPALFSGAPFAANHHAAPWDPSTLLFLVFPADVAFGFTLLLHLIIAGCCTFFYCRILQCSVLSSLLAAAAFLFNSFFFHWLGLISFNAGLIWMPLIPAGIELTFRTLRLRYLAISSLALGFSFLSGMAQFWFFNLILFLAYSVYRLISDRTLREKTARWSAALLLACLLGVAMGSVQLYQTLSALPYTSRGGDAVASPYAGRNHLSPRKLITLAIPDFYGHHEENIFSKILLNPADAAAKGLAGRLVFGEKGSIFHRSWGYTGIVAFLFLLIALIGKLPSPFGFYRWLIAVVLFFQVLLCWEAFHRFCLLIFSGFDTLDHTRTIVLYSFAGAVLAANRLDFLASESGTKQLQKLGRLLLLLCSCLVLLSLLLTFCGRFLNIASIIDSLKSVHPELYSPDFFADAAPKIVRGFQQTANILYFPLFILSLLFLSIRLRTKGKWTSKSFQLAVLILAVIDLFYRGWHDPELVYSRRSDLQLPSSKVLDFLHRDPEEFRIYELHKKKDLPQFPLRNYSDLERIRKGSIRFFDPRSVEFVFRPNTLMNSGIRSAGGYMSLYSGRYKELWQGRGMDILKALKTSQDVSNWNSNWVAMQGIKYLLLPQEIATGSWRPVFQADGIQVMEVDSHTPLIYAVGQARVIEDAAELLRVLRSGNFNPLTEVLIQQPVNIVPSSNELQYRITGSSRSPDAIRFHVNMKTDGYLVIAENFFPGWQASVDRQSVKIYSANYVFMCLPITPGDHDVVLEFAPKFYRFTQYVTFLSIALIAGLLFIHRKGA